MDSRAFRSLFLPFDHLPSDHGGPIGFPFGHTIAAAVVVGRNRERGLRDADPPDGNPACGVTSYAISGFRCTLPGTGSAGGTNAGSGLWHETMVGTLANLPVHSGCQRSERAPAPVKRGRPNGGAKRTAILDREAAGQASHV